MCISQIEFHHKRNTTTLTTFDNLFLCLRLLFRSTFDEQRIHIKFIFFFSLATDFWCDAIHLFLILFFEYLFFIVVKNSFLSISHSSIVKTKLIRMCRHLGKDTYAGTWRRRRYSQHINNLIKKRDEKNNDNTHAILLYFVFNSKWENGCRYGVAANWREE